MNKLFFYLTTCLVSILLTFSAEAASITIDATAAEAARVTEAKTLLEAQLGRSITTEQFVKFATRKLVMLLLDSKYSVESQEAASAARNTFEQTFQNDFPDPSQ